jgi:hypothetical protein
MANEFYRSQYPQDRTSDYEAMRFLVLQLINQVCTVAPVQVQSSSSDGDLALAGRVVIRPLVMQTDGKQQAIEHGDIFDIPYIRVQGGANAVIIDPQPGDIGLALFAMRDISSVKATGAASPPGSRRTYSWSDAIYIGGLLNAVPTQYVRMHAGGMDLVSPGTVRIQGAAIEIEGPVSQSGGDVTVATTLTAGTDVMGGGISLATHVHSGVQTGGGTSGPPVP